MNAADCKFAIHPGGPMIVQSTLDVLKLPHSHAQATWDVLRDYGNMSSGTDRRQTDGCFVCESADSCVVLCCFAKPATLIFVLDNLRKQKLGGKFVPALSFGPGLNVEGALLRASS